ncbi:hypothetical protein J31TS4_24090 [Paenibacillus sp. J31TS4]|nr:hypothetical protein J31TS4_24090 [Paenibacillus sp. J31TS4]
MCSPSYYAAVLKNARLWGEGGAVITEDNMLLADVSMEWGGDRVIVGEQHSVFERWEGEEPIPYAGIAAVLTFYASQNYYHWLFDVLPRIELIRISGLQPDKYIFNRPYLAPYQEETLEKLGIPQSQRCLTHQNFHMLAQTLIVPSVIMTAMYPYPQWACNFLRRSFLPAKIRSGEKKRLYISRANSERNIENEEEVLGLLAEYGFTKVLAETLSVARQADLFAHAEAIVAPHGAGLANLAFCSPGTTVIEFLSPNHVINYFWVLSNHVDADYYYLIGEAEAAEISSPYRVSLSKLQETLRLARL